jgi:methylaspartate ammonia-lyase
MPSDLRLSLSEMPAATLCNVTRTTLRTSQIWEVVCMVATSFLNKGGAGMIRHQENVKWADDVRAVKDGDTYTFEIDITTMGGIGKTLKFRHTDVVQLFSLIAGSVQEIPLEEREASFKACMTRKIEARKLTSS